MLKRDQRGFTLFEILIVLAIIAGIMGLLLPKIFGNKERAKVKEASIAIGQLAADLNSYESDCQKFPSNQLGLKALVEDPGSEECPQWLGPYVKKEPKDPWGRPFIYQENNGSFVVMSLGKDGKEGGSGFDKDISSEDL